MLNRGLVQIYTGQGKGKTTAAFGLAVRAAGNGGRVLIFQFLKACDLTTGEVKFFQDNDMVSVKGLSTKWDMRAGFEDGSAAVIRDEISEAFENISLAAEKKVYDLIILDEIVFCLSKGLADISQVRQFLSRRDARVEVVMTGRGASEELIEMADLVTEMRNVKHPFDNGICARAGIEY